MSTGARRRIESFYPPEQLGTAEPGRRLAAYALDLAVSFLTLGVGWVIWFLVVAQRGQTPGKQLVGLYVMREDGTRAGGWYTFLREWVVKGTVGGAVLVLGSLTGGAGLVLYLPVVLWCTWDRERQCLWDKLAQTYVAFSPGGYRPPTAAELRLRGEQPPALSGRTTLPGGAEPAGSPPPGDEAGEAGSDERSVSERLRELQRLRDEGLITAEQHEERRARILEEI